VHTAVGKNRPAGAPVVLVAAQLSVPGLYLPPVFRRPPVPPPQTIISLPVHTAVGSIRALGASIELVPVHLSAPGPSDTPGFIYTALFTPPHTIITVPVHPSVA